MRNKCERGPSHLRIPDHKPKIHMFDSSIIFVVLRSPPQPFSPGRCTLQGSCQDGITASQLSLLRSACDAIVTLTSWPKMSVLPSLKWACETTTWIAWCHTRSGAHHGIHRIFSITSGSVCACCLHLMRLVVLNIRLSIAKAAALVPESYKCKVSIPWNVHLVSSVAVL